MLTSAERKAAVAAYKERDPAPGVYAVRCQASGEVWVGSSPDVRTIQNRLWFTLRLGSRFHPSLQAAWTAHGADHFSFEVLEQIEPDSTGYYGAAQLKELAALWRTRLDALTV